MIYKVGTVDELCALSHIDFVGIMAWRVVEEVSWKVHSHFPLRRYANYLLTSTHRFEAARWDGSFFFNDPHSKAFLKRCVYQILEKLDNVDSAPQLIHTPSLSHSHLPGHTHACFVFALLLRILKH